MPVRPLIAVALLAAAPLGAYAQLPPVPPQPPEFKLRSEIVLDAPLALAQAPGIFDVFVDADLAAVRMGGDERVVKGAPYCADAVHETVQPLLDAAGTAGNRIVRQTKTRLCRDGEGRTRQELERSGRKLVVLRDPVAREAWVLDTDRKTARRAGIGGAAGALLDSSQWQEYAERMREWAKEMGERWRHARPGASAPVQPAPPMPPTPAAAPRSPADAELVVIARQARDMAEQVQREVQAQVLRFENMPEGAAPRPPTPGAVSWTARHFAPRGGGVVTSLGSKAIDGLKVHGERTTWTIEAGKIGNERPIQIVREVWTSPELMLTVQTRDFDPRHGETNYRLTNVKRGEPDSALMRVPADYSRPAARSHAPAASGRG